MKLHALFLLLTFFGQLRAAEAVLDEKFTDSILSSNWKVFGGSAQSGSGSLTVRTEGRTTACVYTDTNQQLNFVRTPLEIELAGIDIKGTAIGENAVFMLFLSDNIKIQSSQTTTQLRITRSGKITLTLYTLAGEGGVPAAKKALTATAVLPIARLTLSLDAKKATLAFQDSSGPHSESFTWETPFDPSTFEKSAIYLQIHSVSKNDPGTTEISLTHLKVTTNP